MNLVRVGMPLTCIAAILSCSRTVTIPTGVVVVTLDTTRADRLTPYGFKGAELPHLERLAREGVVFEQASSVAPLTLPAHASLFTGLYPAVHGIRDNSAAPLSFDHTTLAEILHDQGFRTAAFVGSGILDPDRNLTQGFDRYGSPSADHRTAQSAQRRAGATIDEAIYWLSKVDNSRFFLWAHLYDPHRGYEPPEPFASRYAHDPYVGEIAYADSQLGRLLDALDEQDLLDRTMVIVLGDHGESLGEHGECDHGIFLYESVMRIPLIVRAPALTPRRVASVVRIIDVMPTILDLLGLPPRHMDGVSLSGQLAGQLDDHEAYAESIYPQRLGLSPTRSLRAGRFKFIEAPRPELYDLELDPREERNLFDERRSTAAAFSQRLSRLVASWSDLPSSETEVPHEVKERLSALGYVSRAPASGETLRDAKDRIGPPAARSCRPR